MCGWSVCLNFFRPRIHQLITEEKMPGEGIMLAMVERDDSGGDLHDQHEDAELVVMAERQLAKDTAEDVWVVDHAWTFESLAGAEAVLQQVNAPFICSP
jgi:hypothetical protein